MIKFVTKDNQYYKWQINNDISVKGWFYIDEVLYSSKNTLEVFKDVTTIEQFIKMISLMNGNFSVILKTTEFTFIAVDRIMSFPLLYAKSDDQIIVSDNCNLICEVLNVDTPCPERLDEFLASGFTSGNNTLYDEIKVLQAGKCLIVNNKSNKIETKEYFNHKHTKSFTENMSELCEIHDKVLEKVFKRMINSISDKQIGLFLSGGYDSRLIAVILKKLNYNNVKCITFGDIKSKEVRVAKSVADSLGFKWILIDNPKMYISSIDETERFKDYIKTASNGYTLPYIQGVICEKLIQDGLIDKDAVFISGNSGDVIEGDQFSNKFIIGKKYTINDIIDSIIDKHYRNLGEKFSLNPLFRDIIRVNIENNNKEIYTYEECQDIYENYNWRERQSKYVVNDARSYDTYLSNEWRLPLWDNELVDFWLKVPVELRAFRKLYYYCVRNEHFKTANDRTIFSFIRDFLKKWMIQIVKLLYPIRKITGYYQNKTQYYGIDFKTFFKIIIYTRGYRTNIMTSRVIWLLKNYYSNMDTKTNCLLNKFF